MADNQKVYDASNSQYTVETEDQGSGVHRQVVKIADGLPGAIVTSATLAVVTATGTTGTLLAASTTRKGCSIFNQHASEKAYINIGAAATTSDIIIRAGEWWHMADFGMVFTEVINCIRAGSTNVNLLVVSG